MTAGVRGARESGFALVEALASLVIVAMMSLLIVQGMSTSRRVWQRIDTSSRRGEAIDGAQTTLRDRVEQMFPATLFDKNPPYVDIDGRPDTLAFVASPPHAQRPAPLRRYRLYVTVGGKMTLQSVSDVASARGAVVEREVLLDHVRSLDIGYFGAEEPDRTPRWRSTWTDEPAPPEVVRIRVTFEPGDPRRWPDLIVRPWVSVDTDCKFNPIDHGCRGRL